MAKRAYRYQLTLKQLESANSEKVSLRQLQMEVENHDELFTIIEKVQQKDLFTDPQLAAEFTIGLKLFSEVILKNRNHLLFDEFWPSFQKFVYRLKNYSPH